MPPRILYDYLVCHVPGKHLYTADTLSRAPVAGDEDDSLQKEVEVFVDAVVERPLPATEQCLNTYRCAHKQDPLCQQVIEHCWKGWPRKGLVKPDIVPYWKVRGSLDSVQLTVAVWPLYSGSKVLAGRDKAENSHWFIRECRDAEMQSKSCFICMVARSESADCSNSTTMCWVCQVVGTDLFEITVDYFSRLALRLLQWSEHSSQCFLDTEYQNRSNNGSQYSLQ